MFLDLDAESAVLWHALLGDIQPRHQLQAQYKCRGDTCFLHDMFLQYAVHSLPYTQYAFIRLYVDIGSFYLYRVFKQRLQQLDDGGIRHVRRGYQGGEVDVAFGQFVAQLLGKSGNFVCLAINQVYGLQQVRFPDNRRTHRRVQEPAQFVISEDIGRIRHANQYAVGVAGQGNDTKTARLYFGDELDDFSLEPEMLQVDERYLQLLG